MLIFTYMQIIWTPRRTRPISCKIGLVWSVGWTEPCAEGWLKWATFTSSDQCAARIAKRLIIVPICHWGITAINRYVKCWFLEEGFCRRGKIDYHSLSLAFLWATQSHTWSRLWETRTHRTCPLSCRTYWTCSYPALTLFFCFAGQRPSTPLSRG